MKGLIPLSDFCPALQDEWALILGASSGFGGATALELAARGMHICGVHLDRSSTLPNAERIIEQIESHGRQARFFNINAAAADKRADVIAALQECTDARRPSRVKVVLHSLAFGTLKPFIGAPKERVSQKQLEMTLDVMANSLVYWVQDLHEAGLLGPGGHIFAMTSEGSTKCWKTYGPVSAAKAALESHIRQLATELAPDRVACNAIRAGVTDTPALRKIPGNEDMLEHSLRRNPSGRLTEPTDVARAIATIAAYDGGWITGNTIGVDGGEYIVS